MIRPQFIFFYLISTLLFSCNSNPEIEHSSAKMNSDSIQRNEGANVNIIKYELKSADGEALMEWPEINGNLSKEILEGMNKVISIDSVCMESIQEIQKNYEKCSCGTVGSGFSVNYNKNNLLSLSISVETMGAYPDGYLRSFNFNTATGNALLIDSLVKNDSLPSLILRLNSELTKRIDEAKAMADEDAEKTGDNESMEDLFDRTEFSKEDLKTFIITEKGISFYFEFGFPHAVQGLEPAGDFLIPKDELKRYLKEEIQL